MSETIIENFEDKKQSVLLEIQKILGDQFQAHTSLTALTRDGLELLTSGLGNIPHVSTHYGEMLVLCAGLLSRATKERIRETPFLQRVP